MIQSSRFNNVPAWFVGQSDRGDYYDHATGTYLGSWSRSQGNFIDAAKQATNVFDQDQWKDRHEPKSTGLLEDLPEAIIPCADLVLRAQRYVAFVGDSYCAIVNKRHAQNLDFNLGRGAWGNKLAWPSLVMEGMPDRGLAHYGFGGRSWWYSWQRFWQDWKDRLSQLDMVIFVHTNADRINNSVDDGLPHTPFHSDFSDTEKAQAYKYYTTYIKDDQFQKWCQQQYFRHIREVMPDVPQMHFFAFNILKPDTLEILPGVKFTTPLFPLSAAEYHTVPGKMPPPVVPDERANHFNDHNNRAMADLVLACAVDYKPGTQSIPYNNFYQADPQSFPSFLEFYTSQPWCLL